jgi:stage II sporulation protein P
MSNKIIDSKIPMIRAINSKDTDIKLLSYVNILKNGNLNSDIFVELPEDRVELEEKNDIVISNVPIENEVIPKTEEVNVIEPKAVTLGWDKILKNETKYAVDIEKLKNEKLKFNLKSKGTNVIIYHTHTTESYTESKAYPYEPSGVFRTLNKNASVVKIGREIAKFLEKNNVGIYHDETTYDHPSYNTSYSKAGKAISSLVKKYSGAKIVLDIHRDAIGVGTEQYKPIIKIDGKNVAQFLIVVGTNEGGLSHSKWRENLKLALKIKTIADKEYPGLCRYVLLRRERFNQQVAPGALIVEMGATGNTVEEVLRTSELFAKLLIKAAS